MKWIWYRLSMNILPFSTTTLEICSGYIGNRTSISENPDAMGSLAMIDIRHCSRLPYMG
ncbi:hypothetical protein Goarm_012998 [Gossypium armourianum]|uniref:Uncharacterized protein n=1 Tax=Gossypium armourianum TaxID=34283 RepID=A0A7J9J2H8_9ROSI|nr:hypothetical protein [Gossypium armourianum]